MTNKILTVSFTNNPQPKATDITLGGKKVTGPAADASKTLIEGAVNRYITGLAASSKEEHKDRLSQLKSLQQFTVTVEPVGTEKTDIVISDGSHKLRLRVHLHSETAAALKNALPEEAPQNSQVAPPPKKSIMQSRTDFPPVDPYFQNPDCKLPDRPRTPPSKPLNLTRRTPVIPPRATTPTPAPSNAAPQSSFFLFALFGALLAWIGRGISSLFSSSEEELKLLPKKNNGSFSDQKTSSSTASTTFSTFPAETVPGVRGIRNEVNTCFINAVFQALMNTPEIIPVLISAHEEKIRKETTQLQEKDLLITAAKAEVEDIRLQIQNLKNNYSWYNHFLPDPAHSHLIAQMQTPLQRIDTLIEEHRILQKSKKASESLIAAIHAYKGNAKDRFEMKDLRGFDSSFGSSSQEDANDLLVKIFDPLLEPLRNGMNAEGRLDISVIPADINPALRDSLGRFIPKFGEEKQLQVCATTETRALELAAIDNKDISQLPPGALKKGMVASSILPFAIPNERTALQDLVTAQLTMQKPAEQDETSVYESNGVRGDYQVSQKRIAIESIGNSPEFISIQLKRFIADMSGHTSKNNSEIVLPENNRITLIVDGKNVVYEIQSVVVHQGASPRSGHYYSFLRKDGAWIETNDNTVTPRDKLPASEERQIYLLVLKRV